MNLKMNIRADLTNIYDNSLNKELRFLTKKKKTFQNDKNNLISKYFQTEIIKKEDSIKKEMDISIFLIKSEMFNHNIKTKNDFKNPTIKEFIKKMKPIENSNQEIISNNLVSDELSNSLVGKNFPIEKNNSTFCIDKFQIHSHNKDSIHNFKHSFDVVIPLKKEKIKEYKNDYKITDWVIYKTYDNWRNIPMEIFHEIFKFLRLSEICKCSITCKEWHTFYKNIFTSYKFFSFIKSQDYSITEFKKLLSKGKPLKHISILNDIIKKDFGNHPENLIKGNYIQMKLSINFNSNQNFILESFKIRPITNSLKNFISNYSVQKLCNTSKQTLKELSLIGCFKLNEKISESLCDLIYLEKLDLSFSE